MRTFSKIILTAPLGLILGLGAASAEDSGCRLTRYFATKLLGDDLGPTEVAGSVNGKPTKFTLDTGGAWGMLSEADSVGLPKVPMPAGLAASDATDAFMRRMVEVKEPSVGGLKLPPVDFLAGRFSTLGGNVLHSFDVEIDPIERQASFFFPKTCGGDGVYWPHRDLAVIRFDADEWFQITFSVVIDGKSVKALFDTGTDLSVLDDRFARNTFDIDAGSPDTEASDTAEAGAGGTLREYRHQFGSLNLGGVTLAHPWIRIGAHGHTFFHQGHYPPLILGMDVISQLHIYISYKERSIYATTFQGDIEAGRKPADGRSPGDRVARWNARELIATAESDVKAGKQAEAADAFDRAVALTPDRPEALLARARFKVQANDISGATADVNRALVAAPQSVEAHTIMGWLLLRAGKGEAAAGEFSTSIGLAPDQAGLRVDRARAYASTQQYDLALADYNAALALNPKSAAALFGRSLAKRAKGDTAGADADLAAARAIRPDIETSFGI